MPLRERDASDLAERIFQEIAANQQPDESLPDTMLRMTGLLRLDINEPEVNLVGGLFKRKDLSGIQVTGRSVELLQSLRDQLLQMSFDRLTTKIIRLERLLGTEPSPEVVQAQETLASGDLAEADNQVRQALNEQRLNTSQQGALTDELTLLRLLLTKTENVIIRVPVTFTGESSGLFIDLLRSPTLDIEERYLALQDRYRALSTELTRLRRQRDLVEAGITVDQQQSISLLKTIDFFLFVIRDVQYNCGQCHFFKSDRCTYTLSNRDTNATRSCVEVWGLIGNDFWTASEEVLENARTILKGV